MLFAGVGLCKHTHLLCILNKSRIHLLRLLAATIHKLRVKEIIYYSHKYSFFTSFLLVLSTIILCQAAALVFHSPTSESNSSATVISFKCWFRNTWAVCVNIQLQRSVAHIQLEQWTPGSNAETRACARVMQLAWHVKRHLGLL